MRSSAVSTQLALALLSGLHFPPQQQCCPASMLQTAQDRQTALSCGSLQCSRLAACGGTSSWLADVAQQQCCRLCGRWRRAGFGGL